MSENTSHASPDEQFTPQPVYTSFDPDADPDAIIVTIVKAVASVTNNDPLTLPPLYDTIHTGALGTLLNHRRDAAIEISFTYEGCRVTASSSGDLTVQPPR